MVMICRKKPISRPMCIKEMLECCIADEIKECTD
jgi:hypothetical protein